MKATILYGPRDIRVESRADPAILAPTDAILRLSASCICGSDLWPYRGISAVKEPAPMGHEYCGIVEEVGSAVTSVKRGQFVINSFFASDNSCPHCRAGYQTSCQHRQPVVGAQAPIVRVPLADGTLVATREVPGFDVSTATVDVSSPDSIRALVETATKHGEVMGVIHAAGVSPSQASIGAILKVDLYGTAVLLEEFGSVIARGGSGIVIASQ